MNLLPLLSIAATLSQSGATQSDQAFLGIFAETSVMKMVGMPAMPELPPGIDPSSIPGLSMMMPSRKLTVRLWSPGLAPANAAASIAPPAGLKQGPKLDLEIYRPKPGQTEEEGDEAFTPAKTAKMVIKIYWGSSATVRPGQPKIMKFGDLSPAQIEEMKRQNREAQRQVRGSYFYKPDWTTAYWPTRKQAGKIAKDAALVGTYALTTNYCGNVALDAPSNVNFLAAIDFTAPSFENKLDLLKAIGFEWKPIPNLLGSYAQITGMEGEDTIVLWYSSEIYDESLMKLNWGYMQMAEVLDLVKKTAMMPGDKTNVTVPAGIFKDADTVVMQMVGFGPGSALDKGQPLPRIQTKTALMGILGGKKMPSMGGM